MNRFDEMRAAVGDARATIKAAESVANDLAMLLRGNLRHVWSSDALSDLKKELQDYNIHTGKWKKRK